MSFSETLQPYIKSKIVKGLIDCGYSKDKAEDLYFKYKEWNKLEILQEFIQEKTKITQKKYPIESNPLRDM